MAGIYAPLTDARPFTSVELSSIAGDYTLKSTSATGSIRFQTGTTTSATGFVVQNSTGVGAPILTMTGDGVITVPISGSIKRATGYTVPCFGSAVHQNLTGPGVILPTTSYTRWTTTGANAASLGAPTGSIPDGFIKTVQMVVDGGNGTLTIDGMAAGTSVWTFTEVGQSVTVMAVAATSSWVLVHVGVGALAGIMPTFA